MTDRNEFEPSREQELAREAIRSLPRVEADPDFRRRLKDDFAAGRLGDQDAGVPRPPAKSPWAGWWRLAVPAAAAVVLVVAVLLNRGPSLLLSDITGTGSVTVDGRTFNTSDRAAIAGVLRPGSRIALSEGVEVDLVYEKTLVLQYSSARATVPKGPSRWIGGSGACRLTWGELRALTGPGFEGKELVVTTPEGVTEITGTLVSVFRDSSVTCVCVQHGTARVGVDESDMEPVPPGMRKIMFADGQPPMVTDIAPPHRDHLVEFEKKYRSGIRPVD